MALALVTTVCQYFKISQHDLALPRSYPETNINNDNGPRSAVGGASPNTTGVDGRRRLGHGFARWGGSPATTLESSPSSNNSTYAFVRAAVDDATSTIANINVAVLEFVGCFLGPRHELRLLYSTVTAIGIIMLASFVPRALRMIGGKRISQHDSNLIALIRHYCSVGQLMLVFLIYPALTSVIMRTFVCAEYAQDDEGHPTFWLVDDTVVQCKATGSYLFMLVYAAVMVVVVVLGFPALLYYREDRDIDTTLVEGMR